MTYSIAVSIPGRKLLGVATASHSLAVGAGVIGIRAGIGAVASQAYTNRSLRRHALDRLEAGGSPQEVVASLEDVDPAPEYRQVAVIDAAGRSAAHTGRMCTDHVAERLVDGTAVIGNLLASPDVVDAMMDAYRDGPAPQTQRDLASRLLTALKAGEEAGGDARGRQSAAVLVAQHATGPRGLPMDDIDLRVDDHRRPLSELQRLLDLHGAQ